MFDVGFWELAVIFGLGLLILGPEKLPRVANKVGRWVGKARRTAGDLRRQLERELDFDELAGKQSYSRPKPPPPPSSAAAPAPPMTDHAPPEDDDLDPPPPEHGELDPAPDTVNTDSGASVPDASQSATSSTEDAVPEPVSTANSK